MDQLRRERCKDVESKRRDYIRRANLVVDNHRGTNVDEFVVVFDLDARHSVHLDNWISFAVKKRVKEIKINLFPLYFGGPNAWYSFMKSAPFLPGIECLSSLELTCVRITGETIEHLLLACPLLERLSLDDIGDLLNLRVVGPSLKLKYLAIFLGSHTVSIEICAPNLVSFHCRVPKTTLRVEYLGCLSDLDIDASTLSDELFQFSSYISQLETFSIRLDNCANYVRYKYAQLLN